MTTVLVENDYPVAATKLWAVATDYDAMSKIMEGIATFEGLPTGRAQSGQKMNVMVSLFGILPSQPYFIEIIECDNERMTLCSSERGAGVKSWLHTLTVTQTSTGSQLTDNIEIDAGLLTLAFALWAKYLYSARHKPRLKMLSDSFLLSAATSTNGSS